MKEAVETRDKRYEKHDLTAPTTHAPCWFSDGHARLPAALVGRAYSRRAMSFNGYRCIALRPWPSVCTEPDELDLSWLANIMYGLSWPYHGDPYIVHTARDDGPYCLSPCHR